MTLPHTHDVIVVGARCAGASTALHLARAGLRVLVVDRSTFPSDSQPPSGNVVQPGLWHLRRWGLLDRVAELGAPPIRQIVQHVGGAVVTSPAGELDGIDHMLVLRHRALDTLLARAAAEDGAELALGTRVVSLQHDGDRVTGIEAVDPRGRAVTATAPIVVGADGKHSFVARAVGARKYRERAAGAFGFFTYYRDLDCDGIELWQSQTRQLIFFPTHDGEVWVALPRPARETAAFRSDPELQAVVHLAEFPDAAERLAAAERIGPLHSTGPLDGFYRESAGKGWALVGDAGFTKDPTPGRGITDAFFHGELLADAIRQGLDERDLDDAVAAYADVRDALSVDVYDATHDVAEWGECSSLEEIGGRFAVLAAAEERECHRMLERASGLARA